MTIVIDRTEQVCCNCKHFIQHYYNDTDFRRFTAVNCGHCMHPRCKHRNPGDSCKKWEEK